MSDALIRDGLVVFAKRACETCVLIENEMRRVAGERRDFRIVSQDDPQFPAGVAGVIITRDQSVGLTPTVAKVASGAAETVPLYRVTNLVRTIELFKQYGFWVTGAAGEAREDIYQSGMEGPMLLVMGAEGKGMRRLTREHCDTLVNIPMSGSVSSLNLSVATGILLFEAVRQRGGSRAA